MFNTLYILSQVEEPAKFAIIIDIKNVIFCIIISRKLYATTLR